MLSASMAHHVYGSFSFAMWWASIPGPPCQLVLIDHSFLNPRIHADRPNTALVVYLLHCTSSRRPTTPFLHALTLVHYLLSLHCPIIKCRFYNIMSSIWLSLWPPLFHISFYGCFFFPEGSCPSSSAMIIQPHINQSSQSITLGFTFFFTYLYVELSLLLETSRRCHILLAPSLATLQ